MPRRKPPQIEIPPDAADRLVESGAAWRLEFEGLPYVRFLGSEGIEPGVVSVGGLVVPAYPKIGRLFTLDPGVERSFSAAFDVEEKIDGYNVRVVRAEGRLVAITRSGFVCPFTTDRLPDLADLAPLFDEDPQLVLCTEVAGPENPYIHGPVPHVREDVALFAFDLMRAGRRGFLPLEERNALFERHGIPMVPRLGRFEPGDLAGLRELVLRLDAQGSEGIVMKAPDGGRRVKYVTPRANLADVVEDASLLAELPGEFFSSRLVRFTIGIDELGLHDRAEALASELGRALYAEFDHALHLFRERGAVLRAVHVRLRTEDRIAALVEHVNRVSKRVQVSEVERTFDGTHWRVTLRKVFQVSTSWLHTVFEGREVFD